MRFCFIARRDPDDQMETQPDISERLATVLGDELVIERELGGGGMSRVFLAFEKALNRRVVKSCLTKSRRRLTGTIRREILTSATLQHPNIVSVISAGDQ
jgi:serine/threonine-protein kinase